MTEDQHFANTDEWRQHIDKAVDELKQTVNTLSSNVASALTIHASNASQIADNTRITLDLKTSLDKFQERAMPAIEVTETMQRGATAIGKTIEFIARWGRRVWRIALTVAGLWLAAKILTAGGSWSDAIKTFFASQPGH
jgi:ElaB/YqjD/DUF883 family membrane-anchored ribosome-binding protein